MNTETTTHRDHLICGDNSVQCKTCDAVAEFPAGFLLPVGWGWIYLPREDGGRGLDAFYACPACKSREADGSKVTR